MRLTACKYCKRIAQVDDNQEKCNKVGYHYFSLLEPHRARVCNGILKTIPEDEGSYLVLQNGKEGETFIIFARATEMEALQKAKKYAMETDKTCHVVKMLYEVKVIQNPVLRVIEKKK